MTANTFTRVIFVLMAVFLSVGCTKTQKSVNETSAKSETSPEIEAGRRVVREKTCTTCHSLDGQPGLGPTFMHLYGRMEKLADGSEVLVDDAYLRESIVNPQAKVVARYAPSMPAIPLKEEEITQILALIRSLAKKN